MQPAIQINNLSKCYQIGKQLNHNQTFQEQLKDLIVGPFYRMGQILKGQNMTQTEEFWALNDLSFDVNVGEVVGIIGRNGAGKSTLLKILSRITDPTSGEILINGRVASLLEVGTGFHPELTGRENVYLNGSILGMTKKEIDKKFDEIVDFSGIEKFLDTPVKRYSSGMYVRLAFSVAAHLDPEILIVDEVLAVGDDEFQKRCLGKMESVSREGRTVLFVSHNLPTIQRLCSRSILLHKGTVLIDSDTETTISHYVSYQKTIANVPLSERKDRMGDGRFRFVDAWIENSEGKCCESVMAGSRLVFVLEYEINCSSEILQLDEIVVMILARNGTKIAELGSQHAGQVIKVSKTGRGEIRCIVDSLQLNVGDYVFQLWAKSSFGCEDGITDAGFFSVQSGNYYGGGRMPSSEWPFLLNYSWSQES